MADFKAVPVQEVHTDNLETVWPALTSAVKNSEFIAIDLELSGLGNRRALMAHSVEDRYKNLLSVVQSRAVISVGMACFRRMDAAAPGTGHEWLSQTFDLSVLCDENYTVEPGSVRFLTGHGFDFNTQYAKGLPFKRGNDQKVESPKSIRALIGYVLSCGRPLVMHNGFVDLAFLYGSFYANLPPTFEKFLADLSVIFESGFYDTKCLAEYQLRLPASFLSYLFRYCQRQNYKDHVAARPHISMRFISLLAKDVNSVKCKLRSSFVSACAESTASPAPSHPVCQHYAGHGFCRLDAKCPQSHHLDDVLDAEDAEAGRRKQKRQQRAARKAARKASSGSTGEKHLSEGEVSSSESDSGDDDDDEPEAKRVCSPGDEKNGSAPETKPASGASANTPVNAQRNWCSGSHRAGFDAFMTGFFFAWCLRKLPVNDQHAVGGNDAFPQVAEYRNKVSLSGKPQPLQLVKSHYASNSPQHTAKWGKLTGST